MITLFGTQGLVTSQAIQMQAGLLQTALAFQAAVGTPVQRDDWHSALDEANQLATTQPGIITRAFRGADYNLNAAVKILDRVSVETRTAGLILADPQDGFANNAARFREHAVPAAPPDEGKVFVLKHGKVRKEYPFEKAERLVYQLLSSENSSHKTLVTELDRAFQAHIARLDRMAAQIDQIARTGKIPKDVARPRYFENVHPELMDFARSALVDLNNGIDIPWSDCLCEIVNFVMERQLRREGISPNNEDSEKMKRGIRLACQIPAYSELQLLCLLVQIRKNYVESELVQELARARAGRTIGTEMATRAGIKSSDLLKASELVGNIDIIHANIATAYALAKREQPNADPQIVALQVRAAVSRLGKATGSSRFEYDAAIEQLKALESNPNAGKVLRFSERSQE